MQHKTAQWVSQNGQSKYASSSFQQNYSAAPPRGGSYFFDDAMLDLGAADRKVFVGRLNNACNTEHFLTGQLFKDFIVYVDKPSA